MKLIKRGFHLQDYNMNFIRTLSHSKITMAWNWFYVCMFNVYPPPFCLLTCSSMNEDTLVGPQVAKVKQHHIGSDVVDREGCCLLKAHALRDEEGVVCRHHRHLLPQPEAVQHHHLVTDLEQKTHAVWVEDTGEKNGTEPNAVIPNQGWLFCFWKERLCVDIFICKD